MTHVRIPYYVVRRDKGFFQPTKRMKAAGFQPRPLGPDGPTAWAEALRLYEDWRAMLQRGTHSLPSRTYPLGSVGHAWERFRRTNSWAEKAPRTREEWDYAWGWMEPLWADTAPATITMEQIEELRAKIIADVSLHAAHRVTKIWRAFWKKMAAMQYCEHGADPSLGVRNRAPKGRSEIWQEGEIARLGKAAWRSGYHGLAALIAIAWDTQFSPVDCRGLTPAQRLQDRRGVFFDTARAKTGRAAIGTLTRRSVRILDAYLERLGVDLHFDAPIFRNRSGAPYSKDTLGDDFRVIRQAVFPGDTRRLMDIRRSGAVEAIAGDVDPAALGQKMGNSIQDSKALQETYLPRRAATVRLADEARKRGRRVLRENE
jgi:hypothetical protein